MEEGGSRPSVGPASLFGPALLGSIFSFVRRGSRGGGEEEEESENLSPSNADGTTVDDKILTRVEGSKTSVHVEKVNKSARLVMNDLFGIKGR